MKVIEARSDSHRMMPGNRKRPPNYRSQNSLANSERKDVALACEKPSHRASANPSERNQHGVGPMKRGENRSRNQRSYRGARISCEEPIGDAGVQPDLLEQAEKHVPKEALWNEHVGDRAMQPTKKKSNDAQADPERQEDHNGLFCGNPQIVHSPAEGLWSVSVQNKADNEPGRKNKPRILVRGLKLPDIKSHERAEAKRFNQIEMRRDCVDPHSVSSRVVLRQDGFDREAVARLQIACRSRLHSPHVGRGTRAGQTPESRDWLYAREEAPASGAIRRRPAHELLRRLRAAVDRE